MDKFDEVVDGVIEARKTYREPHVHNAFEEQEPKGQPFVEDPTQKIFVNPEIGRLEAQIKSLKAMGLFRTAEVNQRKLDRLLREEEGTLEG